MRRRSDKTKDKEKSSEKKYEKSRHSHQNIRKRRKSSSSSSEDLNSDESERTSRKTKLSDISSFKKVAKPREGVTKTSSKSESESEASTSRQNKSGKKHEPGNSVIVTSTTKKENVDKVWKEDKSFWEGDDNETEPSDQKHKDRDIKSSVWQLKTDSHCDGSKLKICIVRPTEPSGQRSPRRQKKSGSHRHSHMDDKIESTPGKKPANELAEEKRKPRKTLKDDQDTLVSSSEKTNSTVKVETSFVNQMPVSLDDIELPAEYHHLPTGKTKQISNDIAPSAEDADDNKGSTDNENVNEQNLADIPDLKVADDEKNQNLSNEYLEKHSSEKESKNDVIKEGAQSKLDIKSPGKDTELEKAKDIDKHVKTTVDCTIEVKKKARRRKRNRAESRPVTNRSHYKQLDFEDAAESSTASGRVSPLKTVEKKKAHAPSPQPPSQPQRKILRRSFSSKSESTNIVEKKKVTNEAETNYHKDNRANQDFEQGGFEVNSGSSFLEEKIFSEANSLRELSEKWVNICLHEDSDFLQPDFEGDFLGFCGNYEVVAEKLQSIKTHFEYKEKRIDEAPGSQEKEINVQTKKDKVYRKRKVSKINYAESDDEDDSLLCDECDKVLDGDCPIHGPLNHIPDTEVTEELKKLHPGVDSSTLSVPENMAVSQSTIPNAGKGIWSMVAVPSRTVFGPYVGRKKSLKCKTGYCWEVYGKHGLDHVIDASDPNYGNWMRYVNCARHEDEQNVIAYQLKKSIFYRTFKYVPPHTEMLTYYGDEYAQQLGIDTDQYYRELKTPLKSASFPCQYCKITYSCPILVTSHEKKCKKNKHVTETNRKYSCKICKKKFIKKQHFMYHKASHSGKKIFNCDICKNYFVRKEVLKNHLITVHKRIKKFKCQVCWKKFSQIYDLNVHKRIHTKEMPFLCNICNKKFNQAQSLLRHKRTHSGEKPFSCTVCSKTFASSSNLGIHIRIHTGEKPYLCNVCHMSFSQLSNMKKHVKIKHCAS